MNVAAISRQIRETGNVHVSVFEGIRITEGKKASFCTADYCEDIEKLTPGEAARLFEDFMADAFPGKYVARLMKNAKAGASCREVPFEKPGDSVQASSDPRAGAIGIGAIEAITTQMEEKFTAKLEKFALEQKIRELQGENKELKVELNEARQPGARLVAFGEYMLEQYLDKKDVTPSKAVAGTETSDLSAEQANDRVNELMGQIASVLGADTVILLEKLASLPPDKLYALAHVNDHKLNLALNFL